VCGCVGVSVRIGREMGVRLVYVCNVHILPPKHTHRSYFTHTHTNAHKVVNHQTVHSPLRNDPCYHPLSHSRTSQTSPSVPPTIATGHESWRHYKFPLLRWIVMTVGHVSHLRKVGDIFDRCSSWCVGVVDR